MTVKDYRTIKERGDVRDQFLVGYVTGVGRGIFWTNVALKTHNMKPLFCMPDKLGLDSGIISSLLEQELRNSPPVYNDDSSIEMILVFSFQKRFPCR
jgi:hypothetical protein